MQSIRPMYINPKASPTKSGPLQRLDFTPDRPLTLPFVFLFVLIFETNETFYVDVETHRNIQGIERGVIQPMPFLKIAIRGRFLQENILQRTDSSFCCTHMI